MKLDVAATMPRTPAFLYDLALRALARSYLIYHPVTVRGRRIAEGERGCEDRWLLVREQMKRVEAVSVLDLGCAEGYFVRQAARDGRFAVGVDGDVRRLAVAQAATIADVDDGAGFMLAQITPEFVNRLPVFDLVLYQSVMHHVMYQHGLEYSREMLRQIRTRTSKALIFDMGQSNETNSPWAAELPDMGLDPHLWIKGFLESAGFRRVEKIGETDAFREQVRRALFVAEP